MNNRQSFNFKVEIISVFRGCDNKKNNLNGRYTLYLSDMSQLFQSLPGTTSESSLEDLTSRLALPFDQTSSSVPLAGTQTDEFSPIFRNKFVGSNDPIGYLSPKFPTFYHVFQESLKIHKDARSIGYRELDTKTGKFNEYYTWESYKELATKRDFVGSGLLYFVEKYAPAVIDDFIVTLFSANRPEWIISDLACHAYSIPNTPLYDTLGKNSTQFILQLTESPIIIFSKSKLDKILEARSSFLKVMISIEDLIDDDKPKIELAASHGLKLIDFKQLLKIGEQNLKPHRVPNSETVYTIAFTSGTTGIPKGVVLKHKHIAAAGVFLMVHVPIPANPTSLVFLPLAHVYERFKIVYELSEGGAIGFPHNPENPRSFMEDIKILKPTHMSSVPRLYSRIESGLKDKIKTTPGFKGWLLRFAIKYKLDHDQGGLLVNILNRLVIDKIKKQIGFENLDFLITGGSPLASQSIYYLRNALNCGFYQGYGSSETFGGIAITTKHTDDTSRTGAIGVTAEFKLRNLPDMDYSFDTNRSGELLLRGPQVFSSYFKNEEATKAAIDKEGWFSTGDIAQVDAQGRIAIIDRVKNFFKLAQGEYIASEKIENLYLGNNPFTSQFFVYGDSFKSFLVAIIGIEPEALLKTLKGSSFGKISTLEQLLTNLNDLDLRKLVLKLLNDNIEHTGLFSFEKVKNIYLAVEPFKVDDETITPTLKLKRSNAKNHYQKQLDSLYAEGPIV